MRNFLIPVLVMTLSASETLAANTPPLKPGKPAGMRQAQFENGTTILVIAGTALVGIGIALATTSSNAAGPATSTTSTNP